MSTPLDKLAAEIRLLALDSDGVLTDSGVYMSADGSELRRFNIKDGLGIKRALDADIEIAIISGGDASVVLHRAAQLGIQYAAISVKAKLDHLQALCDQLNISLRQVAYMGDDLPDLEVLRVVGLPCAPADAVAEVRAAATLVTQADGGQGAVREVCDLLVAARAGSDKHEH